MTPSLAEHKADQLNVHVPQGHGNHNDAEAQNADKIPTFDSTQVREGFNQMIICYSGIAGCFGGSTVLLGKANVSLDDPRYTLAEECSQRLETDI